MTILLFFKLLLNNRTVQQIASTSNSLQCNHSLYFSFPWCYHNLSIQTHIGYVKNVPRLIRLSELRSSHPRIVFPFFPLGLPFPLFYSLQFDFRRVSKLRNFSMNQYNILRSEFQYRVYLSTVTVEILLWPLILVVFVCHY